MKSDRNENEELLDGDAIDDRITAIEQTLEDTRDQLLRRTAELENMRRRHQVEREQLIFEANKRLILDLLEVVDDLERTLEHASQEKDPIAQGIELVFKNFIKTLERYGVRPMETAGEPFDPMRHDALMEEPRTDVAPGTVTREIQRGYLMRDAVLRHAKVFVAKEPDEKQIT
ncbi:MAG: nucleotide exchange factor GrpE [Bacteroidota bacterium]|nr:nucleotide exchange factor GrpE [Bacteroidota bacterium]MDP4233593.1 nucleotide exchange factor GrpE [Bacteroidota bacterium]MDP4243633.1 nucleotide exchange factor GrpE [Bacteroidota bacterium]MDP4287780.1 nucleotide exchange factor GrpE [Bacteroidota bacterium]